MSDAGRFEIAIIGAGLGGAAAAGLLQRAGHTVRIYEQTTAFSRLGAGIHLGPNVMKVMRRLGIEERLLRVAFRPKRWLSRQWDSGEISLDLTLGDHAEA